jgi:hypothetical protein
MKKRWRKRQAEIVVPNCRTLAEYPISTAAGIRAADVAWAVWSATRISRSSAFFRALQRSIRDCFRFQFHGFSRTTLAASLSSHSAMKVRKCSDASDQHWSTELPIPLPRSRVIAVGERIDEEIRQEITGNRKPDKAAKQMIIGIDGAFVKGRPPTDRAHLLLCGCAGGWQRYYVLPESLS